MKDYKGKRKMIGRRIASTRILKGISQRALAEKVGLRPSVLCTYEKGTRSPAPETLARICRELRCTADYILGLSGSPEENAIFPD